MLLCTQLCAVMYSQHDRRGSHIAGYGHRPGCTQCQSLHQLQTLLCTDARSMNQYCVLSSLLVSVRMCAELSISSRDHAAVATKEGHGQKETGCGNQKQVNNCCCSRLLLLLCKAVRSSGDLILEKHWEFCFLGIACCACILGIACCTSVHRKHA